MVRLCLGVVVLALSSCGQQHEPQAKTVTVVQKTHCEAHPLSVDCF